MRIRFGLFVMTYVNEMVADSTMRTHSIDSLVDELFERAFKASTLHTNLSSATLGKPSLASPTQSLLYPHRSVPALAFPLTTHIQSSRRNVMTPASLATPDQFLGNHRRNIHARASSATSAPPSRSEVEALRVAIIGAGPSGTALLRAFASAKKAGRAIPGTIVSFEKQSDIGGLWNYEWRTGLDEWGNPVHNSMYRYLWSNGPKEVLEFADYSFEEHFGRQIASFPPREVLRDYIQGRIDKVPEVWDWIRLSTAVKSVKEEEHGFRVVSTTYSKDEKTGQKISQEREEHFDYVVVASGHFSTPNIPSFPGFDKFEGRILHAHDFRDAREFQGKDILIVGTSYSAEDIASQCWKYGCGKVYLSWRTAPMEFKWPETFETLPLLTKVDEIDHRVVHFKNGEKRKVDAIVLCTGYQHAFSFLPENLALKTANRLWPDTLLRGIFWPGNPNLMYLGMQDQWFTFNMFDAQAWLARDYILTGNEKLIGTQDDFKEWRSREEALDSHYEAQIGFQADYIRDLIKDTDYPNWDIDGAIKRFHEWEHNKHEDIMGFRNKAHSSVMTGSMAPVHHTPWDKAMDDSMASYLKEPDTVSASSLDKLMNASMPR